MSDETVEVFTDDLQVGVYVERLDRPRLETPFLFQGFYVNSQKEIEELRRHCESSIST